MQYCPRCRVKIRGSKSCCPLCHGSLEYLKGENLPESFPVLKVSRARTVSILRIVTFLVALVIIGSITTLVIGYEMTGQMSQFPWFVMIGAFLAWVDLVIARYYRSNVISLIEVQAILGLVICLFIDHLTVGRFTWSLEWVVPCSLIALEIVTISVGYGMGMHLVDYGAYLIIDTILGLLQILPIVLHWNAFPYPAVISIALQLSYVAYAVIFRAKEIKNATGKFLNL